MRLLKRQQVKEARSKETSRQLSEAKKISSYIEREIKNLNDLKNAKQEQIKSVEKEFESRFGVLETTRNELEDEVKTLERKREKALEPLTEREEKIKEKETQVKEKETTLETSENALIKKACNLSDKLELVQDREDEVTDIERVTNQRKEKVLRLETHIKVMNKKLTERLIESNRIIEQNYGKARTREEEARKVETSLKSKESNLEIREKKLKEEQIVLSTRQASLRIAFEEARKKRIN